MVTWASPAPSLAWSNESLVYSAEQPHLRRCLRRTVSSRFQVWVAWRSGSVIAWAWPALRGWQCPTSNRSAAFLFPTGIAIDVADNLYVTTSNKIRKINPLGVVTTLAGSVVAGNADGTGAAASFDGPNGIAVDGGGFLYVADGSGNLIRKGFSFGCSDNACWLRSLWLRGWYRCPCLVL